jgi:SAM-dependent methyltransferase
MSASFLGPPPGQEESLDRMAAADNYNAWLLERAQPFIGSRVLDFGAGIGTFTEALASRAEIVAIEPDSQLARGLRERFAGNERAAVVEADAAWLAEDSSQGAFDTVLCLNVLEHIRDDALVLRGFHDCLAPGGHLLLLVPAHARLYGEIDRSVGHERRYSRGPLCGLLEQEGLEPVDIRYVNPLGAVGWLVASRLLRRDQVPAGPLRAYDRLVPVLRGLDRLRLPFGLSLWAVGRRVT